MNPRRRKLRLTAAGLAVVALIAAGCSSSSPSSTGASSGGKVTGGTATVALPAGITYSWIFPF
jgi:hypothetical protein